MWLNIENIKRKIPENIKLQLDNIENILENNKNNNNKYDSLFAHLKLKDNLSIDFLNCSILTIKIDEILKISFVEEYNFLTDNDSEHNQRNYVVKYSLSTIYEKENLQLYNFNVDEENFIFEVSVIPKLRNKDWQENKPILFYNFQEDLFNIDADEKVYNKIKLLFSSLLVTKNIDINEFIDITDMQEDFNINDKTIFYSVLSFFSSVQQYLK